MIMVWKLEAGMARWSLNLMLLDGLVAVWWQIATRNVTTRYANGARREIVSHVREMWMLETL